MLGSRRGRTFGGVVATAAVVAMLVVGAPNAPATPAQDAAAPQVTRDIRFTASDGVELQTKLGGVGPIVDGTLPARPLIVEISPYRPGCCTAYAGDAYNYLQVHIRGTGDSDGAFDALGDRTQQDLVEVLAWACEQPWSNGRIGLYGFSASAITVYNSLHHELPCVETAVLGAGTHELYRDLMYPGGIPNLVPAIGVLGLIGAPSIQAGPDRFGRAPLSVVDTLGGMFDTGISYLEHPTLDQWWQERGMRGDVNDLPILMVTGFYDVESRGPFQVFQELRGTGSHLMVVGAHDGVPEGSGGSDEARARWYDRHLRDIDNRVDEEPAVQLWLSNGDREAMLAGDFAQASGEDWPLPGTRWASLALDPARSGSASTVNDGTLSLTAPAEPAQQSYLTIPSLPTASDPHTTSLLGIFNGAPLLTDLSLVEPLGLSFTTPPLAEPLVAAGPGSVELLVSTTVPGSDLYVILSDVGADGTAHPVATGRLRTDYPAIDPIRSLHDDTGAVVQPYGRFDVPDPAQVGEERRYHVELWPVGNRFQAGHRLRLHVVGASAYHLSSVPAVHTVRLGGADGSRLLLPVLPGSDAGAAIGGTTPGPAEPGDATAAQAMAATPTDDARGAAPARLPATGADALPPGLLLAAALAAAAGLRRLAAASR